MKMAAQGSFPDLEAKKNAISYKMFIQKICMTACQVAQQFPHWEHTMERSLGHCLRELR